MNDIDLDHPFKRRYEMSMPGSSPSESYAAHKSIESAICALANTGQIRVWTLQRSDEAHISGIYATLRGAVEGARHILADELVPPDNRDSIPIQEWAESQLEKMSVIGETDEESQRIKYEQYMFNEVQWEVIADLAPEDQELRYLLGDCGYKIRTSYGDTYYDWDIVWSELMP